MTFDQYCLNSFISGFEIARPNHLINMMSYHFPQFLVARSVSLLLNSILGCTLRTLFEAVRNLAI